MAASVRPHAPQIDHPERQARAFGPWEETEVPVDLSDWSPGSAERPAKNGRCVGRSGRTANTGCHPVRRHFLSEGRVFGGAASDTGGAAVRLCVGDARAGPPLRGEPVSPGGTSDLSSSRGFTVPDQFSLIHAARPKRCKNRDPEGTW
jgi:hypothetical protein